MNAEFNNYAPAYSDLLRDPIRDRFGADSEFFHRRKLAVILDFLARRNITPNNLSWLDIGCGRGELLRVGASLLGRAAGFDSSPEIIAACKSVELFTQISATEPPFPVNSRLARIQPRQNYCLEAEHMLNQRSCNVPSISLGEMTAARFSTL